MNSDRDIIKKTKEDYNKIADHFSETRKYPWKDFEFLFEEVPAKSRVLDMGCGNGRFYQLLKDKDVSYIGIDKSERLIEKARERYPEPEFLVGDGLSLPFKDESFDFVFSIAVLHHLPSEESRIQFLSEARRVLKKSGKLKFSVWDLLSTDKPIYRRNLKEKLSGKIGLRDIFLPWKNEAGEVVTERYYHAFKESELSRLAEKAELKEVEVFKKGEGVKSTIFLFAKR